MLSSSVAKDSIRDQTYGATIEADDCDKSDINDHKYNIIERLKTPDAQTHKLRYSTF